jgi:hypothetical protein
MLVALLFAPHTNARTTHAFNIQHTFLSTTRSILLPPMHTRPIPAPSLQRVPGGPACHPWRAPPDLQLCASQAHQAAPYGEAYVLTQELHGRLTLLGVVVDPVTCTEGSCAACCGCCHEPRHEPESPLPSPPSSCCLKEPARYMKPTVI